MQDLVLQLWQKFPCLALFVTHDVTEALRVADRILVLSTRPASIVADMPVTAPKPRPDAWLRSPECTAAGAADHRPHPRRHRRHDRGTLTVDV